LSKLVWKPGTMLYPVPPALVSLGTVEAPQVLTIAWCGIVCTDPAMTYISVRPSRHSYATLRERGEFVINLTTAQLTRAADFCGVRSGRDVDKFAACHLTAVPGSKVSAPLIEESPINLECRVTQVLELGSHHMFLAEILAVNVDESAVTDEKLRLDKCDLVAYSHGHYVTLGKSLGAFGYSVRKKSAKGRKPGRKKS